MSSTGAVVAARSSKITVTNLAGAGAYCVAPAAGSGITPAATMPTVTPDVTDGTGTFHVAQVVSAQDPACAATTGWVIFTSSFNGTTFVNSDNAFSILIP